MKITKNVLKKLIKEELGQMTAAAPEVRRDPKASGGIDINQMRKVACTKFGQNALLALAKEVLNDPGNLERHIGPLAAQLGMDASTLAAEIRKQPVPPDLAQIPMMPSTVGAGLDMLGGWTGAPLRMAIGPALPGLIKNACDLSKPLEEGRKITKSYIKKLVNEEIQKALLKQRY